MLFAQVASMHPYTSAKRLPTPERSSRGRSSAPSASLGCWDGVSKHLSFVVRSACEECLTAVSCSVINVVIAFYMGTDLEGIMANPIGQPMATVSRDHRHRDTGAGAGGADAELERADSVQ